MVFKWSEDELEAGAEAKKIEEVSKFEDVRELIGRFNAALTSCDYGAAARIIEALFNFDRHGAESFQAKECQRTDLVCQCLDSFSTRIYSIHEQRAKAAPSRRPVTHFDANWTTSLTKSWHMDEEAIEQLSEVNKVITRHSASQRFRRVWLNQSGGHSLKSASYSNFKNLASYIFI